MSSRTITYLIKLLSNIDKQANRDAQVVEASNQRMTDAYKKTGQAVDKSANQIKQAQDRIAKSAQTTTKSLDKMGAGIGPRLARQLDIGLVKLKQMQSVAEKTGNVLGKIGKGTGIATVGAVGGAMVLKPQIEFDRQMSINAATMFGTKDDKGRKYNRAEADQQKQRLTQQVDASIDGGVGDRNQALIAQNALLTSGKFNGEVGLKRLDALLPSIMKASAGSNTAPEAMASMAVAFANKGYDDQQIARSLAKGMISDSMGSFKVSSMANWMPKWLAGAGETLKGEHAADTLFTHAQTVRKTSGSDDEAGVNMENVIGYATSNKADNALAKIYHIDREKEVSKNMAKGDDFLSASARMIKDIYSNDPKFKSLIEKSKKAGTDSEKGTIYEEMAGYTKQGVVGDIYSDLQARKAVMAIIADLDKSPELKNAIKNEDGSFIDDTYNQRIKDDAKSAVDKTSNAKDSGVNAALTELTSTINMAADAFAQFSKEHSQTVGFGTIAAGGGASVMGAAWVLKSLGGKKDKEKPSKLPEILDEPTPQASRHNTTGSIIHEDTAAKTPAPIRRRNAAGQIIGEYVEPLSYTGSRQNSRFIGPQPSSDSRLLNVSEEAATIMKRSAQDVERLKNARLAGRVGGLASAAVGVYDAYKIIGDEHTTRGQKAQGLSEVAGAGLGGWGGAYAGAAAGAALGSIVPILGTAIGGVLGGLAGGFLGSKYGGEAGHAAGDVARTAIDGSNTAQLTSAVQAGVTQGMAGIPNVMQQPPAYLNTPVLNQIPPPPQAVDLSIRDGKLQVQVQVTPTSSLIEAVARANQPAIPLQLAGGGNTNPASYSYGGQR